MENVSGRPRPKPPAAGQRPGYSVPTDSFWSALPSAHHSMRSTLSDTNVTEPSPSRTFAPPGCSLPAVYEPYAMKIELVKTQLRLFGVSTCVETVPLKKSHDMPW